MNNTFSWQDFNQFHIYEIDRENGLNNSYSNLRLFGQERDEVELILYRDRHSWCPYCQKIWLWLEYKRIPYIVRKVNMFCYGEKESWYLEKVRSGKLPAVELGNKVISESDDIIYFLENEYGLLGHSIFSNDLQKTRLLEREIFRSWCNWLCKDSFTFLDSSLRKKNFISSIKKLEELLSSSKTGFIDPSFNDLKQLQPGTGDLIFIPYIERMNASLCY